MKRIFTAAFSLLILAGAAQAQNKKQRSDSTVQKHEYKKDHKKKHAAKELDLSADQKAKMKDLQARQKAEMEALRTSTESNEAKQAKRKELMAKYQQEREAILTPEQREKIRAERKERVKRMEGENRQYDTTGRHKEHHGKKHDKGDHMDKMQKELNLSETQKSGMRSIMMSYKAKFDALKADTTLTKEQKKERAEQLRKAQHQEMMSLLNKEQQAKMNARHEKNKKK